MSLVAQITNPVIKNSAINDQTGNEFFKQLVPNLVGLAFVGGVLIFFFMMLVGAIQWITAGGDKASLETARGRVTSAIVGVILLLSTFVIIKIIEQFFNVHILTLDILGLKIE
jgi:hypothetical protein